MINFGSGTVFGLPNAGDLAANPTPMKFGVLQDVQVDISGDQKELFGQYQYPVDSARGKVKITWKCKAARLIGKMVNDIFFAETLATPMVKNSVDENGTVPAVAGPYTITVTNAANFYQDQGVEYAATGLPLTRVAAGPALGQYSVNSATGVYTFAAADTLAAVKISYLYNAAAGVGVQIPLTNHLMGYGPVFQMVLANKYKNKFLNLQLNACMSTKLTFATKQDDYTIPEFDGSAYADAANNIGMMWFND